MGAYASQADMVARFGEQALIEVTARSAPVPGEIDATAVASEIEAAESTIETYLRARGYATPLPSWPKALTRAVVDVAWWYLRTPHGDEGERQAYTDALRWARDVGEGKAELLDATGGDAAVSTAGAIHVAGPEKVFSRDKLRDL